MPRYNNLFKTAVWNQIKSGRDCVIVIVGAVGIGKTINAYSLATHLNPNFNRENWKDATAFGNADEFSTCLQKPEEDGFPLLFDELGFSIASTDWQGEVAKAFQAIMQVRRIRRRIIIFVLPSLPDTVKSIRRSIDFYIEVKRRNKNFFVDRISGILVNRQTGKIYYPRLKFTEPTAKRCELYGITFVLKRTKRKITKLLLKPIDEQWRKEIDAYGEERKDKFLGVGGNRTHISLNTQELVGDAEKAIRANPSEYIKVKRNGERYLYRPAIVSKFKIRSQIVLDQIQGNVGDLLKNLSFS